jgi:hypothetical protein
MFAMLLPTTLPIVISELPSMEAKIFTKSSGADVPNDTIVSPITICETPNLAARDDAPLTRKSAPLTSKMKPRISKIKTK